MAKKKKKKNQVLIASRGKPLQTRNWLAGRAYLRSGAGAHSKSKYSRKVKHKAASCR